MTLYRCVAFGTFLSGRSWSFRQNFSSSAVLATVQADWAAQVAAAWTDGTHGLQTLYPTTTVLTKARTYQLFLTLAPPGRTASLTRTPLWSLFVQRVSGLTTAVARSSPHATRRSWLAMFLGLRQLLV